MSTKATQWKISDELWERMEPLLPKPVNTHPRGGGRKRVSYRKVMTGILFVLRTGCQWKALDATGICSGSTAHIRSRGEEAKQLRDDLRKKARRWVAERTHSWLNGFRRILVRWEKKTESYVALLHFVFGLIAYRCSGITV